MFDIHSPINTSPDYDADKFDRFLANCPLQGLGTAFIEAGHTYGINALFLMSLAILETGWGRSVMAQTKNNLFGINAVDSNPDKAFIFASKERCIDFAACMIANSYLKPTANLVYALPNGWHWTIGLYWGGEPTPHGVFVHYSSSHDQEAQSIVSIMNQFLGVYYPVGNVVASMPVKTPIVPQPGNYIYTVRSGDNLWNLATHFYGNGAKYIDIATANDLPNPNMIHVGQPLLIPNVMPVVPTPPAAPTERTHTVIANESLWGIALRAYGDGQRWNEIYQANKEVIGPNPNMIHVGTILRIP